jgi:fermentation-respiration switch protein FrsA (DUF1100 family)
VLEAAVIVGVLGYLALLGGTTLFQRDLLYARAVERADVARAGIAGLTEIRIATEDGETLVAWYMPPRSGRSVLLYLHGNAGNLATPLRLTRLQALAAEGFGFIAVGWRGYGGSTGRPTEAGLHADARAGLGEAARRYGIDRIVIYGESLGTGPAIRVATEHMVRAIILEAPYTSVAAVVERFYPIFPVRLLLQDQFHSAEIVRGLRAPLLVLHGDRDWVIPLHHGEQIFALAPTPKRFVVFPGGGHEDLHARGAAREIRAFLADVAAGRLRGAERRRPASPTP